MSACISRHGEFGEHETDVDYACRRCGVFDESEMLAELRQLRQERLADLLPASVPDGDAIERAAREMWRQEHGRISSHDSERTPESDERESAEDGYRQWDRSVSEAVKDACRRRMAHVLTAALASPVREPGRSEAEIKAEALREAAGAYLAEYGTWGGAGQAHWLRARADQVADTEGSKP